VNPAERRAAVTLFERVCEPEGPTSAIRDKRWLENQDAGFLQDFEDAVTCLQTILRRILADKWQKAGWPCR
jgi:hypothetical protein